MSRPKLGRSVVENCADCGSVDPTWASINKGILICDECCGVHRTLGRHISHVKSLRKGTWVPTQLAMVHALHSNGANSIWEHSLLDPANSKSGRRKPQAKDPVKPTKADFIRTKHQMLGFVYRGFKTDDKDKDASGEWQEADVSKQLHSSVRTANLETSLRLLSCGADPNFLYHEKGTTPLHVAAGAGQASQIELLLIYGSDPGGLDSFGKTPGDHASEAGYHDIAYRLLEYQYELTDRLGFYVCERKPDHSSGQHFVVPISDSLGSNAQVAKSAKRKLQLLPNYLIEELAMDAYDEVDRRETETIWLSMESRNIQTAERANVPFLPVNSELSATRNQARQKLGRLNNLEFTTLLVDILSEAKRRQLGSIPSTSRGSRSNKESGQPHTIDVSDDEPLYDSVPMEEESIYAEQPLLKKQMSSVSVEAYMSIKEQLSLSNSRMQELLTSNTNMQSQISILQDMVQKLVHENQNLKAKPVTPPPPAVANALGAASTTSTTSTSVNDPVTMRSKGHVTRHCSMYEPREGPRRSKTPVTGTKSASSSTFMADEVSRRSNIITKRIQDVFRAVQERRLELVEPSAERIVEAVQSMAAVCQQGLNEEVRLIIHQLTLSASRLLIECKSLNNDSDNKTQRIIQGAYDVAKATKQLVTVFQ